MFTEEEKNDLGRGFEGVGSKEEVEKEEGSKGDREGEVEQEPVESVSGHPGESSSAQRGRETQTEMSRERGMTNIHRKGDTGEVGHSSLQSLPTGRGVGGGAIIKYIQF